MSETPAGITTSPPVYDIGISRGKDGVLRCKFRSKLLPQICASLAENKKKSVTLGEKTYEIWDCEEDLVALAEECGVQQTTDGQLLNYRNGKIESLSLVPLCAVKLGEADGLVLEPSYPYSATSLDAYAKLLKDMVRTVLAAVAPVEISVKLLMKSK